MTAKMEALQMTKPSVATPLSVQVRAAAHGFASRIERGFFSELSEEQRCELRSLPMSMAVWADQIEMMERECLPNSSWQLATKGRWNLRAIVRALLGSTRGSW